MLSLFTGLFCFSTSLWQHALHDQSQRRKNCSAASETCNCRAVRPVPAACWPEVAVLLCKPLSCHGPLYVRDHFSCHPPATTGSNTLAGLALQRRLGEYQKLSRSTELPLSVSHSCGLNFNFLGSCCKSRMFFTQL